MKIAFALLALCMTCAAPAAIAGDAKELLRDKIAFCSQFVIHDPDPRLLPVEWPGGLSPPGSPRTVREPLDSYGSHCPAVAMT